MKRIFTLILMFCVVVISSAQQNLSSMSETERNEYLLKNAKEAVKKYAPDYVKYTDGKYEIGFWKDMKLTKQRVESVYTVKFFDYNPNEEMFTQGYAVVVDIRVDDGGVTSLANGHGWGIIIPRKLTRGQQIPKLEYKRVPPPVINPDPHGKQTFY